MTLEINYTGVKLIENPRYEEEKKGDQFFISLTSERRENNRFSKQPWTFGTYNAKKFLEVFQDVLMAYADWSKLPESTRPAVIYPFSVGGGKFPARPQDFTELRVRLLQEYLVDVQEYVEKYGRSSGNGPRQLVDAPEILVVSDINVKYNLLVPCYPKRDMDFGEGSSGAWEINTWTAKMLYDPTHQLFSKCKEAIANESLEPVRINYLTKDGEKKEFVLDEYQIRAFVNFKSDITEYKASYVF